MANVLNSVPIDRQDLITDESIDKMAEFIIDDITMPFVFHEICPKISVTPLLFYDLTFSCLAKMQSGIGQVLIGNEVFDLDTTWKRIEVTMSVHSEHFVISFLKNGTYDFACSQLELGNKATSYVFALEDSYTKEQLISQITQTESTISMSIKNLTDGRFSTIEQTLDDVTIRTQAGETVISGNVIKTGIIEDAEEKFYLNLDTGMLHIVDGIFEGEIEAESGTVGGWEISETDLSRTNSSGESIYINDFGIWSEYNNATQKDYSKHTLISQYQTNGIILTDIEYNPNGTVKKTKDTYISAGYLDINEGYFSGRLTVASLINQELNTAFVIQSGNATLTGGSSSVPYAFTIPKGRWIINVSATFEGVASASGISAISILEGTSWSILSRNSSMHNANVTLDHSCSYIAEEGTRVAIGLFSTTARPVYWRFHAYRFY